MMYPYVTLQDYTEITYSDMSSDGTVQVYVETPYEEGEFHNALCILPQNDWKVVVGYSQDKMTFLRKFVECNAALILECAQREYGLETWEKDSDDSLQRMKMVDSILGIIPNTSGHPDRDLVTGYRGIEMTGVNGYSLSEVGCMTSFLAQVHPQLRGSGYRVFSSEIMYQATIDGMKMILFPQMSITMLQNTRREQLEGSCALLQETPKFVLDFIYQGEDPRDVAYKLEMFQKSGIEECWLVDFSNKTIQVYTLAYDKNLGRTYYRFVKVIGEIEKVHLTTVPDVAVNVREMFEE